MKLLVAVAIPVAVAAIVAVARQRKHAAARAPVHSPTDGQAATAAFRARLHDCESGEPLRIERLEEVLDRCWPPENKVQDEPYPQLFEELWRQGICTEELLEELIDRNREEVMEDEWFQWGMLDYESDRELKIRGAQKGVYYTHAGLTRVAVSSEFEQGAGN